MQITVTITTDSAAELARLFAAIDSGTAGAAPAPATTGVDADGQPNPPPATATAEQKQTRRRRAAKPEPEQAAKPEPEQAVKPEPTVESKPEPAEGELDYNKDVRPKILEASQSKDVGLDRVVELLGDFGVKRGQDLPADKLGEFLDKLAKLGEPAEDGAEETIL